MALNAEDRLNIHQLTSTAYQAIDSENAAGWAGCFSEDGKFVAAYGEWTGRAAIEDFMAEHINKGKEAGVRHYLTNFEVLDEGDGARVRFYILKISVGDTPGIIATAAADSLVCRTDGMWRFSRFQLDIDAGSLAKTTEGYGETRQ